MVYLVQQYFSESARRYSNKPAILCNDAVSTFDETESFTNAVANQLRNIGIARGSFVPFFMKKGVNAIHSILGILKTDCAYVPIDVNSPANRVDAILSACDAPIVIVDTESRQSFEELFPKRRQPNTFIIDEYDGGDSRAPVCRNLSIDIAYVLFTSGSTGVPKGVMIPHKAIIDYIDWCVDEYQLTSHDVIANHAPLYFDNSTFDIYTAFKTGAELHLIHDELNAVLPVLVKWLHDRQITTFFCVPSVLSMLLRSRRLKADSFPNLRHLICAGEVLQPEILRAWMIKYPHVQFTNMYGPTEITVDCSYHIVRQIPGEDEIAIPIGKSRPNMELFVRDDSGSLKQEPGARGELLVRGTSVAYGYLGDEEKSHAVFIQNPNHDAYQDQLYCTGDLVEIDQNEDFLFLGRTDDQIKFLGHRIELGEIETALASIKVVHEAVVVFHDADNTQDREIGAMVTADQGVDKNQIIDILKELVPPYMVPSQVRIEAGDFPLTPNGKYDRKAVKKLVFG